MNLNLLAWREEKIKRQNIAVIIVIILAVIVAMGSVIYIKQILSKRGEQWKLKLHTQQAKFKKRSQQYPFKHVKNSVQVFNMLKQNAYNLSGISRILKQISEVLPENVYLEKIQYTEKQWFFLISLLDLAQISEITKKLSEIDNLHGVYLHNVNQDHGTQVAFSSNFGSKGENK